MPALFIDLPCKTYVKRYLINHFGDPAKLLREHSSFLYMALEKQSTRRDKAYNISYPDKITLKLVDDLWLRSGWIMSNTTIVLMNRAVEFELKKEMRAYLDGRLEGKKNQEIRLAIFDYMKKYNFNETDFPYDTIKKDYYRHRKRVSAELIRTKSGTKKNVGQPVPC